MIEKKSIKNHVQYYYENLKLQVRAKLIVLSDSK